jgi:Tfp pilus assembly pilus retraction ATPase PilT
MAKAASDDVSAAADNELVKLVNKIIIDAYQMGASDIHIEPGLGKDKVLIRFRKDGSLQKYIEVPASYRNAMVARLKIMCDLDIAERRKPQDGKIKFKKFGPLDIELRVATMPSTGGVEDVVMRILAAGEPIPLDKLGVLPTNLTKLKATISKPYGLFFVCGPTGSGKTTTLHSVLGYLNTVDTKIWTAEDPVEITQKGLRQVQVNKKVMDFATVMKAFLRADPDIIMVGEMRDAETTGIGIEASLTGHLVFATLHTNSAPESIIRLLDMGMDPFNFADALLGILAQRLAKRLCKCKESLYAGRRRSQAVHEGILQRTGKYRGLQEGHEGRLRRDRGAPAQGLRQGRPSCVHPRQGLRHLWRQRLQGARRPARTDDRHRADEETDPGTRPRRATVRPGAGGRHADPEDGRSGKGLQGVTDLKQVRAVCIKSKLLVCSLRRLSALAGVFQLDGHGQSQRPVSPPRATQRDRRRALQGARHHRLLESILLAAKTITHADGGTLYRMTEDRPRLRFEILRTDSLRIAMGGTTGNPISFPESAAAPTTSGAPTTRWWPPMPPSTTRRSISPTPTPSRLRFFRHPQLRRAHRLPLAVLPHGADEEPRGRDHRRAATDQRHRSGQRRGRARSLGRPEPGRVAGLAGGHRADQPHC